MSAELLGAAFKADISPHAFKLVMLKLVDAARDDGTKIYPSVKTIAKAAGVSERHTKRVLHGFVGIGLLSITATGGRGRGDTTEYSMDVAMLVALGTSLSMTFENGQGTVLSKGDMATPNEIRVTPEALKGDASVTQPLKRTLKEDSRESTRASAKAVEDAFDGLTRIWPKGSIGNSGKARTALADLSTDDLKITVDRAPRYLRALKDAGKSFTPSIESYVKNREFDHHGEPEKPAGVPAEATLPLGPFDRPIWWMLWARVADGKGVAHILRWLTLGVTINASAAPSEADESALMPVKVGSPECDAWVTYCAKLGFRLPVPNQAPVIFVPSDIPPLLSSEWNGYALIEPARIEYRSPAWWWRLYQPGAPISELLEQARRRHGADTIDMGPIASPAEALAMIEINNLSREFESWSQWFWHFRTSIEMWPAHAGPIYVPSSFPPEWKVADREKAGAMA